MKIEMEWIDIWKVEPPRFDPILFLTSDGETHLGSINEYSKLRKCSFCSYVDNEFYECDREASGPKVIAWHPVPDKIPKELQNEMDRY